MATEYMDSHDFLTALAPALTNADARERFLANPRRALAAAGLALPDWVMVTATEGSAPELTITLPPMLDADSELSEENLSAVSGGCHINCCNCSPDERPSGRYG